MKGLIVHSLASCDIKLAAAAYRHGQNWKEHVKTKLKAARMWLHHEHAHGVATFERSWCSHIRAAFSLVQLVGLNGTQSCDEE